MIEAQDAVASVLRTLQKNAVPLEKVVLHKFLYFLDTRGIRAGLRFEPWTYGPFSFDLAKILDEMVFWDKLKEREDNKNRFEILDLEAHPPLDSATEHSIEESLQTFKEIVGAFTFDNLECVGTTLYCAESLAFQGEKITVAKIIKEFQAWKGTKYPEEKIRRTFDNLKPYLSYS